MSERYTSFLEVAPDAIVIIDGAGTIEYVNEQAEFMFRYKRERLIGQPVEILLPERFRNAHAIQRSDYSGAPMRRPMGGAGMELYGLRSDGTEMAVDISLAPIESTTGLKFAAAIRDVTAQQEAVRIIGHTLTRTAEWFAQIELALAKLNPGKRHP